MVRKSGLESCVSRMFKISLLTILWLTVATAYATENRGRVVYLRGSVTATDSTGVPRLLRQDSRVMPGDEIETSKKSVAQLIFPDGSTLQIKPSSKVVIEAFHYNAENKAGDKVIMKALKGSFRSLTGALGKRSPDKVEYKTLVATIGIRGTAIEVGADDNGVSFANFDFGHGFISNGAGRSDLVSGKSATVRTHTDQIQTADLQRAGNDPATLASIIVAAEHKAGIDNADAICTSAESEDILLLVALERHVPKFVLGDLMASIEGLASCLDIDIASPMLTVSSAAYPESADKLLEPAVRGGMNISIALDSVLRGMDNAEPEMVDRVVINAVENGISIDEAQRILTGLREDGLCR